MTSIGGIAAAPADTLILQGSTTFNAQLIVPFQAEIERASGQILRVIANKSKFGVVALLEKRADLAMISTSFEAEIALLRESHPDLPLEHLQNFEISRTRVAFAVHPSNPVRKLTLGAMAQMLRGEVPNWQMLGGADVPVRVVAVPDGGGTLLSVETQVLGGDRISVPNSIRVQTGAQVMKVVEQEPGALGITQLGIVRASGLPELQTDEPVEQRLSLISFNEPTQAARAVIDATRRIAAEESEKDSQ